MDHNRVQGSIKQAQGNIKEAVGRAFGDAKLRTEGKADRIAGQAQNAMGGMKDSLRDRTR
jgi:uncharacterized protein YjbJ (UPF0337 family)